MIILKIKKYKNKKPRLVYNPPRWEYLPTYILEVNAFEFNIIRKALTKEELI